jgi:ABC-type microcin C transport system duplicated ATPase subunit YejF
MKGGFRGNREKLGPPDDSRLAALTKEAGEPILSVEDLVVEFTLPRPRPLARAPKLRAVNGVSLKIFRGESLGLVGESGSGKTTLGRAIVGLAQATSGRILFAGSLLPRTGSKNNRSLHRELQMIFQDPYSSLNPYMNAGTIIGEGLIIHSLYPDRASRLARVEAHRNRQGAGRGTVLHRR